MRTNKVEPEFYDEPTPKERVSSHGSHSQSKTGDSTTHSVQGHGLRELLPHVMNEQNRKTLGTWQRKFDFTRTIIGYILGIQSFFRFPYLCYKYGGIFFVPYVIMMKCVAVPTAFMEFTIGQYYGVCSYLAFTHMSPILGCVSKLLTFSCVVNCWMYAVMMAWLRVYASESTSCLKGWEVCDQNNFYNSPHCWTGISDDLCNDPGLAEMNNLKEVDVISQDLLYYNYECRSVQYYCDQHGWTIIPGKRRCMDDEGHEHTIYERRYHAMEEYFYGNVLGLKRNMDTVKKAVLINETLSVLQTDIHGLRKEIYGGKYGPQHPIYNKTEDNYTIESVRIYIKDMQRSKDAAKRAQCNQIRNNVASAKYQKLYWTRKNQDFVESEDSSSYISLQAVSLTTWITIAVFLFEDLLKISFLSYVLNAFPISILIYVTGITLHFPYAWYGIQHLFQVKQGFWQDLANPDMWAEATVQAIYASGIGSGCLISLATFNNFETTYLFDLYFTLGLSLVSAVCGVLISFGSIGHYMKHHDIDVPFWEYIKSSSSTSSIEFCFIAYSHFLTLMRDRNIVILGFFFMITSFATDTAVRLIQNVLDTIHAISPRLKHHSTMVLSAVCVMGYLILVPVMKNGGYVLYIDFEYFVTQYMMPSIVAVEIGCCIFIYRASRVVDHAEQMGVFQSYSFRIYITTFLYVAFVAVSATVIVNVVNHKTNRFNELDDEPLLEMFGWVFFVSPFLMALLSVLKHLIVVPAHQRRWLLVPLQGRHRRAFLRRAQASNRQRQEATDQEQIRAAAQRMRVLESKFILAMVRRRREEQEKNLREEKEAAEKAGKTDNNNEISSAGKSKPSPGQVTPSPLFASLVRVAAAEFAKEKALKAYEQPGIHPPVEEDAEVNRSFLATLKDIFTCGALKLCRKPGEEGKTLRNTETVDDLEDKREEERFKYLDMMDAIERWPGRLDESEIESEGSSVDGSDSDMEHLA